MEQANIAQRSDLEDNEQIETGSAASGDIVTLEHLAQGSERVGGMVIRSAQMRKVLKTILRLGPYKATVLIHGESGTGKELVARALHTLGPVPNGPFVTFNCSNLVESLAESQLFGHIKGAFTDAREDSIGYFRSANGGTLFLDEIGDLPLKLQPKLLRAVEAHEVQPVGSAHTYKVDIRLVAATNRDLRAMVRMGQFRDDLYYRLNTAAIFNPPLRERREAIPSFIAYYIEHYNRLCGKNIIGVERAVLNALTSCPWPGNVRELAHAIESAVILTDSDVVLIQDLPEHIVDGEDAILVPSEQHDEIEHVAPRAHSPKSASQETWPFLLDEVIKRTLIRSLEETDGNRRRAADLLGVSRSTLYRMLARYGLDGGNHEPAEAGVDGGRDSGVDSLF
ncbi:MAG TPA: sigma-54 dependent transcriptional regulator [Candidatus Binataceae bacterium]|nr:sigma-54 dependent transcriptional regulator [Candidatus Binataceae bacterium]